MASREKQNDQHATPEFQRVFEQAYEQLRAMAQKQMASERSGHTLRATELVHQAYVRLADGGTPEAVDKRFFLHAAAEAMRRILIEHARRRSRLKRGGDQKRVSLGVIEATISSATVPDDSSQLLALDDAMRRLEENDPRAAQVVRLRFYGGLTIEQAAEAMELSPRTVKREWEFARAWLARELA